MSSTIKNVKRDIKLIKSLISAIHTYTLDMFGSINTESNYFDTFTFSESLRAIGQFVKEIPVGYGTDEEGIECIWSELYFGLSPIYGHVEEIGDKLDDIRHIDIAQLNYEIQKRIFSLKSDIEHFLQNVDYFNGNATIEKTDENE